MTDSKAGAAESTVAAAYERHFVELEGYLTRVTRDPEVAADLAQEAFLKLLIEVRSRQAPDNVRAWLYRVALNAAVSRGRRIQTAQAFEDRLPGPAADEGPEETCLRHEAGRMLAALLASASPVEQRALVLAAGGADGLEIAREIGRTHGATRTLLHRARVRLRDQALLSVA